MEESANPTSAANPGVSGGPSDVAGYLATTTGKLVIGGVLLLVVLGVLAGMFFTFFGSGQGGTSPSGSVKGAKSGASATATAQAPVEPTRVPLNDSFTYRPNIFAPTVSLPASLTAATSAAVASATPVAGTTGGATPVAGTTGGVVSTVVVPKVPANTLFLESIASVGGAKQATLVWNGKLYLVGAGDVVGDTPWKVLSISGTSVVMLFGDDRVTISVGQGLTK